MDEGVRLLFTRALDGEPAVPAGDIACAAMVAGRRLRRRRGLAVGATVGVGAVLAAVLAVATIPGPVDAPTPPGDTTPPALRPVAMMMMDPACTLSEQGGTTAAVIFLRMDVTEGQRRDLGDSVRADRRVRDVRYESSQNAYDRFARLYSDAPDLVGSVKVDQIPDAFLVDLAGPSAYAGFRAQFDRADGVDEILGFTCPDGLPKGVGR